MARIFIDSQFFGEPRHKMMENIVTGKPTVMDYVRSRLLEVYHYCYSNLVSTIPEKKVDLLSGEIGFARAMIDSGLAERNQDNESFVNISGMTSRTEKLKEKVQCRVAAGKKSAASRALKFGSAQPNKTLQASNICSAAPEQKAAVCSRPAEQNPDYVRAAAKKGPVQPNLLQRRTVEQKGQNVEHMFGLPNKIVEQCSGSSNDVYGSKILDREIHIKKKDLPISATAPAAAGSTPGARVWEAYRDSMVRNWPGAIEPPRSAKTNSQCKQLVDQVGEDLAVKLAAYYPTRRNWDFVQAGHPLGLLLLKFQSLIREMNAGVKLTPTVVKEIVRKEETENFQRYEASLPISATDLIGMSEEEYAEYEKSPARLAAIEAENKAEAALKARRLAAIRGEPQTASHDPEKRQIGPSAKVGA